MSNPYLPPETFDHVIDLLHDKPQTLRECCLVSKSWVPRTRKHLFADIKFHSADYLESWKETFPDPSNSPAYHALALIVGCPEAVIEADAEEGGWIQSFSCVERLTVSFAWANFNTAELSLVPFHKLSLSLKSLHVTSLFLPHSQVFHLARSLPLLEDLTLIGHDMSAVDGPLDVVTSTSPALTGTLELFLHHGLVNTARRLLELPNGLHFRRFNLSWYAEEDLQWIMALVVACSKTLEYLDVSCELGDEPARPIDLSKATRLKDVVFRCGSLNSGWVTMTLKTITSQHRDLQRLSIHIPHILSYAMPEHGGMLELIEAETPGTQWPDLDRLLLELWDSRSIRPKVVDPRAKNKNGKRDWAGHLLPEITKSGIINLVDESSGSE